MNFRLKRLELSGFKSFAKSSVFDFPQPITAIVGPNGSGKSNVAESIRWVLGEQSLKSLRGKKGEDLIFNGSQSAPRLSKASVALHFDNSSRQFPVEFSNVVIGRRVYRDGQSEYLLNDSQVRLKDIIELLGNVGLGVSQHHIIGQGESDRILYSSPKERQATIEDALGLKIYQFKRQDSERKLAKTEENMRQAQALQKEIGPHLKHLERMVEKYKQASEVKSALEKLFGEYMLRLKKTLDKSSADLSARQEKPLSDLRVVEKKISDIRKKLEGLVKFEEEPKEIKTIDAELAETREKKIKIERDLGRLEGAIEASQSSHSSEAEMVPKEEVEDVLTQIDDSLSSAMDTDVVEEIYAIIQEVVSRINIFINGFPGGQETKPRHDDLLKDHKRLEDELQSLNEEEKNKSKKRGELQTAFFAASRDRRTAEKELLNEESAANAARDVLRSLDVEEEKIKLRSDEFLRDFEEAKRYLDKDLVLDTTRDAEVLGDTEREKMRREIDRLKFRLEEAGGLDQAILKEYEEMSSREAFFTKELEDLGKAAKSLRQISKELGEKMESDFDRGIEKINKEFQNFFETMFGGGRARLNIIKPRKIPKNIDENIENETAEDKDLGGIEVDASLPMKKVKGLDMLSGGERALTSIALLFAMSTVNPPPFLVLDETDAALDESNSRRYGEMLKSLSKTTQIITITHNRETMRKAQVLYGITMGSDGVSRMLSLKLSEAEEIAQ